MNILKKDLVIIGGGPAGLAAALEAKRQGINEKDILIAERDSELGGILNQCIHAGFGVHIFGEDLTGPEYATKFIRQINEEKIEYFLNSMVLDLSKDRVITLVSPQSGLCEIEAKAVILAMGCRERTRGALNIPGTRPSGILTAGTAQRFVNIEGYMPGREVVILGSGDIGLIMARRMTLEGAKVKMVCELMPYSNGLARNIAQCLGDFDIPLKLSHTVVGINGKDRLESVVIAKVDEKLRPIKGTEEIINCDTLLLSVGLIPENELTSDAEITLDNITSGAVVDESMMTSVEGIFACGNVLHVHDLVDFVTEEGYKAGKSAAEYIKNNMPVQSRFSSSPISQKGDVAAAAGGFSLNEFASNKTTLIPSRELRKNMTKQEKHLWYDFLYNLKPQVLKQRPIGSYVVDFYCHAAKLAIELDGAQHYEPDAIEYDKIRTEFINSLGIEVIRVDNSDVDNNFVGTCDKIKKAIEERNPPPSADGTPFCERGQGKAICETKPENGVRYIVPQRVTISNLKSGDKFFFRVDNIYKNCRIVLKSGEKIIYSKKKIKAVPSEMESIIIDEKILDGLNKIDNIKNIVICLEK